MGERQKKAVIFWRSPCPMIAPENNSSIQLGLALSSMPLGYWELFEKYQTQETAHAQTPFFTNPDQLNRVNPSNSCDYPEFSIPRRIGTKKSNLA